MLYACCRVVRAHAFLPVAARRCVGATATLRAFRYPVIPVSARLQSGLGGRKESAKVRIFSLIGWEYCGNVANPVVFCGSVVQEDWKVC